MARTAVSSVLAGSMVPDEIVVVDQSDDPFGEADLPAVDRGGCRIRVERCRPGLSRAVNHGARAGSGEILVVVHDDVLVDADWLSTIVDALVRAGRGSVATGRVGATDAERPGAFAPALRDDPRPAVHTGTVDRCVIRPMNIALWRSDHLAVGGYDERLGPGTVFPGGEDHDYSRRLLAAGLTVHYVPEARVRHRAWRDRSDYLPLRWAYGLAHGAFYARSYDASDRRILHRVRVDVVRRLRLVPHALLTEPREGIGHLVFLVASVVGAVRWTLRYGAVSPMPTSLARPAIAPVPLGTPRPRWSVMVPAYNCAAFLGETLTSVLEQDDGEMQIEVVDDHSTADDPGEVVRRVGGGRVSIHRHGRNQGNIATFNTCLARSCGRYVHILHGDDRVLPGFYERLGTALDAHPECVAAISGQALIDEEGRRLRPMPRLADKAGVVDGLFERLLERNLVQAPAIVVRRDAYEAVGGFDTRIGTYGEDWEMWTRLAALGPVWYDPSELAAYRLRSGSITASAGTRCMEDMKRVIAINRELAESLVPASAADHSRAARRWAAERTARRAVRALDQGDTAVATTLARAAVVTMPTPAVVCRSIGLPLRWAWRRAVGDVSRASDECDAVSIGGLDA